MKEEKLSFYNKGYLVVDSKLNQQDMELIRKNFFNILKTVKNKKYNYFRVYDDYSFVKNISAIEMPFHPDIINQGIINLLNKSKIFEYAKSFLNDEDIIISLSRYHMTKDYSHLGIWHRDAEPNQLNSIQINYYLYNEIGFEIIPRSHNRDYTEHENRSILKTQYCYLDQSENLSVKENQIMIFHPALIHRGKSKKDRVNIHFRFEKLSSFKNKDILEKTINKNYLNNYVISPNVKKILNQSILINPLIKEYDVKFSYKNFILILFRKIIYNFLFFLNFDSKIYIKFNVRPNLKLREFFIKD